MNPTLFDYYTAILNAKNRFRSLDITASKIDEHTVYSISGEKSIVFKVVDNKTSEIYALKCFDKFNPDLKNHYSNINKFLEEHTSGYLLKNCEYLENEIFVNSAITANKEYPILKMPWIEGNSLLNVIETATKKKNVKLLKLIKAKLNDLVQFFHEKCIVHGNIDAENIIVNENNDLILVDYDSMIFDVEKPYFKETKNENFQHPSYLSFEEKSKFDYFSLLVLSLSLEILISKPQLFTRFHRNNNLIFALDDYKSPDTSELFKLCLQSKEDSIKKLSDLLIRWCKNEEIEDSEFNKIFNFKSKSKKKKNDKLRKTKRPLFKSKDKEVDKTEAEEIIQKPVEKEVKVSPPDEVSDELEEKKIIEKTTDEIDEKVVEDIKETLTPQESIPVPEEDTKKKDKKEKKEKKKKKKEKKEKLNQDDDEVIKPKKKKSTTAILGIVLTVLLITIAISVGMVYYKGDELIPIDKFIEIEINDKDLVGDYKGYLYDNKNPVKLIIMSIQFTENRSLEYSINSLEFSEKGSLRYDDKNMITNGLLTNCRITKRDTVVVIESTDRSNDKYFSLIRIKK